MTDLRARIVEEAEAWLGTPFHHEARVKGSGVDCAMLIAEVYERVGLIERITVPHYPPDWHLHQRTERYLDFILDRVEEVEAPAPGDLALFHFGHTYSHGAIVTDWPRLIHAYWSMGVVRGDARLVPLLNRNGTPRDVKFFSPPGL